MKIIECVPNFSEGRRKEVIDAIKNAACNVSSARVLDCESDASHNRMVLTFVGEPDAVKQAALSASEKAIELIDLRKHKGEHPRMGAVDVVPFIPIRDATIEECVRLANEFAAEYAKRFNVPVFLYEAAARRPERRDLATVRQGQFEGLMKLIGKDPSRDPDYGPKSIHPTAGATAVGARNILVAYNVNLATTDLSVAKKIAHRVRERDGGLPAVKALGFELKDKGMVQVSMNLTDYNVTSILKAFDAVSNLAREYSIEVAESEIVGLVPLAAISEAAANRLNLAAFMGNQIIESKLLDVIAYGRRPLSEFDFSNMSLSEFSSRVASRESVPGGGSVSAYAGVLAASLVAMVCRVTLGKRGYGEVGSRVDQILKRVSELSSKFQDLVEKDARAYSQVASAYGLSKVDEKTSAVRTAEIQKALKQATEIPAQTMEFARETMDLATEMCEIGNKNARSDAETAIHLARAAVRGASSNAQLNLESIKDSDYVKSMKSRLELLEEQM